MVLIIPPEPQKVYLEPLAYDFDLPHTHQDPYNPLMPWLTNVTVSTASGTNLHPYFGQVNGYKWTIK